MKKVLELSPKKLAAVLTGVLILVLALLAAIFLRYDAAQHYECTNYAFGTYIQQTVYGKTREQAAASAAAAIGDLEDRISLQGEDSDIAKLDAEAGSDWTQLHEKTVSLLNICLDVAEKSGGAYDPTLYPVASLWDFGGLSSRVPDRSEIEKFLPYVGYENLRVDGNKASLKYHSNAADLSAVENGAACDEGTAAYRSAGATAGLTAAGRSVGVYGRKPGGKPWSIAVQSPQNGKDPSSIGSLEIGSGFVSTADTSENSFRSGGVTYHSLLNPKTGYPENNGLVSVTVWYEKSGAAADALARACFVLGPEKALALAERYGAGVLLIDDKNKIVINGKMQDVFHLASSSYTVERG